MRSVSHTLSQSDRYSKAATIGSNGNNNYNKNYTREEFGDLIDNTDYLPWFTSQLKRIGITQFREHAKTARREGRNPGRFFVWLIKNSETVARVRDLAEFVRDKLNARKDQFPLFTKIAWRLPKQTVCSLAGRSADITGSPAAYFNTLAKEAINGRL